MRRALTVSVSLIGALVTCAAERPLSDYESIVHRQMFGRPPAGFDPTKNPNEVPKRTAADEKALSEVQEKVKKAISFTVINTSNGETKVGFSDFGDPQNPVHYFLKEGEERNGWLVKKVDPVAATMTIEKDGVEVSLQLGGDSSKTPDAVSQQAPKEEKPQRGGIREQRRRAEEARLADAAKRAEEAAKRAEEEKRAREEERQERREMYMRFQEELQKVQDEREAAAARAAQTPASEPKQEVDSAVE